MIFSQVDRQQKEEVTRLAEQHREQLGAVQRQFRQANVKVCFYLEKERFLGRYLLPPSGDDRVGK